MSSATASLPVIKIPVKFAEKIAVLKKLEKKKYLLDKLSKSRKGNVSVPIISCKNKTLNYYFSQTYGKFDAVPLASKGWHHRKSAGDYFVIHGHGSNPAFSHPAQSELVSFSSLGLDDCLVHNITNMGYRHPTVIQALSIPTVLQEKNSLITAETGNGKTLAYLSPIVQQIIRRKITDVPFNSPVALIIAPGRELVEQIKDVGRQLCGDLNININAIIGGHTKQMLLNPEFTVTHILVATPGVLSKLKTHGRKPIKQWVVNFSGPGGVGTVKYQLLKSVTHCLVGCLKLIQGAPAEESNSLAPLSGSQITLVSATMPRSISTILESVVEIDSLVKIDTPFLHRLQPHVPQRFFRVNNNSKPQKLLELAQKALNHNSQTIIFCKDSKTSDYISYLLNDKNIPCLHLHGNLPFEVREGRFKEFTSGKHKILSCTSLSSRGLDTTQVAHIINYDFPHYMSDYIHRCGRTGRVGSKFASLVTNLIHKHREVDLVKKIEYSIRKMEHLPNVNANIKRIVTANAMNSEMEP